MKFTLNLKEILNSTKILIYVTLVVGMIAGNLFSAIITILPAEIVGFGSTELSILGYVAHCSFAPWSTIISLVFTGLGIFLLIKLINHLKLNNVTFIRLIKIYAIATIVLILIITCFPFVLLLIGAYVIFNLIEYFKPKFEQKWVDKSEARN